MSSSLSKKPKKRQIFTVFAALFLITVMLAATACDINVPFDTSSHPESPENSSSEPASEISGNSEASENSTGEPSSEASSESSGEESSIPVVSTEYSVATEYVYHIPERYYSDGIKNIVRRARQLHEISWLPLKDVTGFNADYVFKAGTEVCGIPYGQPVEDGQYVCYGASLATFAKKARSKDSEFYRTVYLYEEASPYYSNDCSALVSYSWNTTNRLITSVLVRFGDYNGNSLSALQVGDAIVKAGDGAHAVLVTGIIEDSSQNIIWIETIEQTPPSTKLTRYGDGELYSVDEFIKKYLDDGFGIYRNTDFRNGTVYNHNCASPIDGEWCEDCHKYADYRKVTASKIAGGVSVTASYSSDKSVTGFEYTVNTYYSGIEKWRTDPETYMRLRATPVDGETRDYIAPGTALNIFQKVKGSDGGTWGQTRFNGFAGWVWLDSSEHVSGTVAVPETKTASITGNFTAEGFTSGAETTFTVPLSAFDGDSIITVYAVTSDGARRKAGTVTVRIDK